MSRPPYNEKYDYKAAHLSWIANHPNFQAKFYTTMPPVRCNNYVDPKPSYLELMTEWYLSSSNKMAYFNYYDDLMWYDELKVIQMSLNVKPFETNCSFVTVGFNHQEFEIKKALEFIKSVLNSSVVLDGSFAVMELHRTNGEHPHVHFKMYWPSQVNSKPFYQSMLIQMIHRAKHGKKLILKSNWIDVKPWIDIVHTNYLDGVKTDAKLDCVNKDIEWRSKNQIPDKIYK